MEKFDYQQYRNEMANKLKKEPDHKVRRDILSQEKQTWDYKDAEWLTNKQKQRKPYIEHILKKIGIEKDPDGKIILYHATLGKNIPQIMQDRSLHPPKKTSNRAWRHPHEDHPEKLEKIYLATEKSTETIASYLQKHYGGSAYILEVHVDEKFLLPDEDTGAKTWIESLSANQGNNEKTDWGRSCSYKGNIENFKIHKKLEYILPAERREHYFDISGSASKIPKEMEEETKLRGAEEEVIIGIIPEEFYNKK